MPVPVSSEGSSQAADAPRKVFVVILDWDGGPRRKRMVAAYWDRVAAEEELRRCLDFPMVKDGDVMEITVLGCDCPCHSVIFPGLIPCPKCGNDG